MTVRLCASTTTHAANVRYCKFSKMPSWWDGRVRTRLVGRLGSEPRLVSRIESGPRLVGRVRSEVQVSDSFDILSCAIVRAIARSCGQVLGTPEFCDLCNKYNCIGLIKDCSIVDVNECFESFSNVVECID